MPLWRERKNSTNTTTSDFPEIISFVRCLLCWLSKSDMCCRCRQRFITTLLALYRVPKLWECSFHSHHRNLAIFSSLASMFAHFPPQKKLLLQKRSLRACMLLLYINKFLNWYRNIVVKYCVSANNVLNYINFFRVASPKTNGPSAKTMVLLQPWAMRLAICYLLPWLALIQPMRLSNKLAK